MRGKRRLKDAILRALQPLAHLVVLRALVKLLEDQAGLGWNDHQGLVLPGEEAHGVQRVEPYHGDELQLLFVVGGSLLVLRYS